MVVGNRGHGNSRGSLDSWSSNMVGSSRGNSRGNSNCGSWGNMMVGSSWGNSNGGSWGNMMIGNRSNDRGCLHLNSLDLSNSRSSNCVVSNNRGSYGDNHTYS